MKYRVVFTRSHPVKNQPATSEWEAGDLGTAVFTAAAACRFACGIAAVWEGEVLVQRYTGVMVDGRWGFQELEG